MALRAMASLVRVCGGMWVCKDGAGAGTLAMVGEDPLDLLVGSKNRTFLPELKNGSKPHSRRKPRPAQQKFFDTWQGQAVKVEDEVSHETFLGWCP